MLDCLTIFIEPVYDDQETWQATIGDINSSKIHKHTERNSPSIHHYVFLTGHDGDDKVGIAITGTPCLKLPDGLYIIYFSPNKSTRQGFG